MRLTTFGVDFRIHFKMSEDSSINHQLNAPLNRSDLFNPVEDTGINYTFLEYAAVRLDAEKGNSHLFQCFILHFSFFLFFLSFWYPEMVFRRFLSIFYQKFQSFVFFY